MPPWPAPHLWAFRKGAARVVCESENRRPGGARTVQAQGGDAETCRETSQWQGAPEAPVVAGRSLRLIAPIKSAATEFG